MPVPRAWRRAISSRARPSVLRTVYRVSQARGGILRLQASRVREVSPDVLRARGVRISRAAVTAAVNPREGRILPETVTAAGFREAVIRSAPRAARGTERTVLKARETGTEAVREVTREAGTEIETEAVRAGSREAETEVVREVTREAETEAVREVTREAETGVVREVTREAGTEAVREDSREAGTEAVREVIREAGTGIVREDSRGIGTGIVREDFREAETGIVREDSRGTGTEAGRRGRADVPRVVVRARRIRQNPLTHLLPPNLRATVPTRTTIKMTNTIREI